MVILDCEEIVLIKKGVYLMNKKQLIIAAMAAVLSVTGAGATDITGITGVNNVYDINPEKVNGDVGYRAYNNFELSSGDVANLIYKYNLGDQRNIETFINLVKNGVDIQGALNTVRNGEFYNGHAVFITPGGLTVGASGVLNVGTLSVATPTSTEFTNLKNQYDAGNFTNINQVSQLKKDGNAPINVQGYIFSRNGIDLPGTNIDVSGKIVNGLNYNSTVNSSSAAAALFNQLVNTNGEIVADSSKINSNGSLVFLHSFDKGGSSDGINVSGTVANLTAGNPAKPANGSVALTSAGAKGINVTGKITANGKLSVFNKKGDLSVSGSLLNKDGELAVTNSAGANSMTLASTAKLTNEKGNVSIINNGKGALTHNATVNASKDLNIVNDYNNNKASSSALTISGTNTADTVRIVNRGNKLEFSGTANGRTVSVRNHGNDGMNVGGQLNATEGVLVDNYKGAAELNKTITVENGNIAVRNRSTAGKLTTTSTSDMDVDGKGFIAIKNESSSGAELNGSLDTANGEIAINNENGAMTVNGTIVNTQANTGIINRGTGALTIGANIDNNKGTLKLANVNGSGFTITQDADIDNNGQMFVYNDKGQLTINGNIANKNDNLYIVSRANSTGVVTGAKSSITNTGTAGNLAIKHKTGTTGGVDLNGTISNTATNGQTAINNYGTGDMHVGGEVTSSNEMGIVNRASGNTMNVNATIKANGSETNIKNLGKGNMTVAGSIEHNGRLNILGNTNKTTLDGTIVNKSTGMTYATSRANGTGLEATKNFNASATNGEILIKNISGQNGLNFAGTISSTNGQAEVYNKAGNLTVTSDANVSGNKAFILNTGEGMTVSSTKLPSNIMMVNKGSKAADVPSQYRSSKNFREKLK